MRAKHLRYTFFFLHPLRTFFSLHSTSPATSAQFTGFTGIKVQILTRGAWCSGCQAALLLLYCYFTAALLLLYCCFTAGLLLFYCCSGCHGSTHSTSPTTSSRARFLLSRKVLYCCFTAALLVLYWCFTAAFSGALPPLAPDGVPLSLYLLYY